MISHEETTIEYILKMRPLLITSAVFSDETPAFRDPNEPKHGERMTVRLRTAAGNIDTAFLRVGKARIPMRLADSRCGFDYYETAFTVGSEVMTYYFEINTGEHRLYYTKTGLTADPVPEESFVVIPDYEVPAWLRGAVMYQIYIDRFCNGDPSNDVLTQEYAYIGRPVSHAADWDDLPEDFDVCRFYGGDLSGVLQKLDYLQDLGVEVIYFNPLFVSPSNHKYDTQDYEHIDPHVGVIVEDGGSLIDAEAQNNAGAERYRIRTTDRRNLEASDRLFAAFMDEIHRRGMKVIIDGVFNHCGSFNKWLDREGFYAGREGYAPGAYHDEASPYRHFFRFAKEDWPDNGTYEGWWGHDTLPKLNYEGSTELMQAIMKIAVKWVSPPYNVDGWRLDVAADLGHSSEFNHSFWQKFRREVREANPQAVVLAEHYGDASSYLRGGEWDTVMNYDAFMDPLSLFLTGMEKHSDESCPPLLGDSRAFFDCMKYKGLAFSGPSLHSAMNQLDNHDHSRFLTRTNHKVGRASVLGCDAAGEDIRYPVMRQAVMMQMTWPGAPTLYYGDEAGVVGFTDPDNRRTYPWGHENRELLTFYREAIALHRGWPVLREGSFIELAAPPQGAAYARFDDKEQVITVVNTGDDPMTFQLPVWMTGIAPRETHTFRPILASDADGVRYASAMSEADALTTDSAGMLTVTLGPSAAVILGRR